MERKLVQKQIIPKKYKFHQALLEVILSMNLSEYSNKKGNKKFTTKQKLAVVILYFRSQKSLRDFCFELKYESLWPRLLKLKYEINKSTLNSWVKLFDLKFIRELIEKTNQKLKPKIMAIDGTGIDTDYKSKYFQKRLNEFGKKPKSNYHKLDVIIDVKTKLILDYVFLLKQRHDAYVGEKIFKRLKFQGDILADKGYDSEKLHKICKDKNSNLISPMRKFTKNRNFGFRFENKINFDKEKYNLRNNVEGTFSTFKRKYLGKMKSKNHMTKKREMGFKILLYNLNFFLTKLFFWFNICFPQKQNLEFIKMSNQILFFANI